MRLQSARDGAEHCACQWLRGTVDVVTSLCADEMTGVLPTSLT